MAEIRKNEVMKELESLSATEHYYSAATSGKEGSSPSRLPLVTSGAGLRLDRLVKGAAERALRRISGWGLVTGGEGSWSILLREGYRDLDGAVEASLLRMTVLEVWHKVLLPTSPELARIAEEEYELTEDRLVGMFCR